MEGFYIHETAVVDPGAKIGQGTRIWHFCHIMGSAVIGKDCTLGQNVFVGDHVVLGSNVKVQNNVSVYTGVVCDDDVFIGPSVVFTNVLNPRSGINRKAQFRPTIVGKGVTIGANATIICGNRLGQYCFIGAGAVVTHDVPDYALVTGNPARHSGWVGQAGNRLSFDSANVAICPETGERYHLSEGQLKKLP